MDLLQISHEDFERFLKDQTLLEKYSGNQIYKALVQMIPKVGPLLDAFLSQPGTRSKEVRMNLLFLALYKSLHEIEQKKLNSDWIKSEEFEDMLRIAVESSLKTRSREKVLMNAMILTNLIDVENDGRFRPEEYLNLLADLSPTEVQIILIVYKAYTNSQDPVGVEVNDVQRALEIDIKHKIVEKLGIDNEDLSFVLTRITRTGLIRELTGMYWDYHGEEYAPTNTLFRFMEYLNQRRLSSVLL